MKLIDGFLNLLFPDDVACKACGREAETNGFYLCSKCMESMLFITTCCTKCGRAMDKNGKCRDCGEMVHLYDKCASVCQYEDSAAALVKRLKYGNQRHNARAVALFMAQKLNELKWEADMLVPVPMHKADRKSRGYNQAELIAGEIAVRCGIPMKSALQKVKRTEHQAELDRKRRLTNLRGAIKADPKIDVKDKRIILIDDVYTTGSTADACAEALYAAEAKNVKVLTFLSGRMK